MSWWDQAPADVRLADGPADLAALAASTGTEAGFGSGIGTLVVVDVLSFSTCVAVVVAGGSSVLPLPSRAVGGPPAGEAGAGDAAGAGGLPPGAVLAGPRALDRPSLSPASLLALPAGTVLALPSPNGATLTLRAAEVAEVLVGCLRTAAATAAAVRRLPVLLVAAGERWPDGSSRPALEDRLGAGLIADRLRARGLSLSTEAGLAADLAGCTDLGAALRGCASGRELAGRGYDADLALAAEVDAGAVAARLAGGLLVGTGKASPSPAAGGAAAAPSAGCDPLHADRPQGGT